MDFQNYDIRLTIKAICMFERFCNKSFFDFTEDDLVQLLYCTFYTTNNTEIMFDTFVLLLENEEVAKWAVMKYKDLLEVIQQFIRKEEEGEDAESTDAEVKNRLSMTDMATSLIVDYHIDAHYVMYEMNLWEIEAMYKACDTMVKKRYEEERLWAYIGVMPHIDNKKVKGPDDLIPFPWENKKDKKKKELEKNTSAAMAFLGGNRNGERSTDNRVEQE